MHAKLKSFILTAVLFASVSCLRAQVDSSRITHKKLSPVSKLSGKWYLVPALDSDTATGHIPEIQFDVKESRFTGNTGCNRMSGSFLATDSTMHFSEKMITTRMVCAGFNESAFLQNLIRVDSYKFRKGMLIFTVGNVEVFRWTRKNLPPKKTGNA
ncbi:MAG TPA: META domain-containing protein [Puia sp.]|jgi:heat shock protein HslJ